MLRCFFYSGVWIKSRFCYIDNDDPALIRFFLFSTTGLVSFKRTLLEGNLLLNAEYLEDPSSSTRC